MWSLFLKIVHVYHLNSFAKGTLSWTTLIISSFVHILTTTEAFKTFKNEFDDEYGSSKKKAVKHSSNHTEHSHNDSSSRPPSPKPPTYSRSHSPTHDHTYLAPEPKPSLDVAKIPSSNYDSCQCIYTLSPEERKAKAKIYPELHRYKSQLDTSSPYAYRSMIRNRHSDYQRINKTLPPPPASITTELTRIQTVTSPVYTTIPGNQDGPTLSEIHEQTLYEDSTNETLSTPLDPPFTPPRSSTPVDRTPRA
jgi:hypothetical protein